jgi:hypothetical protein
MPDPQLERMVEALSRDQSPERDEVVTAIVDHVFSQKLRDLVDFEEVRSIATRSLTKANLDRIFERHVIPGYSRYIGAVSVSTETVGAFVPESARDDIISAIQKSKLPRGKWTNGAVDKVLVTKLFAPVWTNLLLSFAKRLPIPGISGSGGSSNAGASVGRGVSGIAGRITRTATKQAERLVDAGKSVMGGLGTEVERRLQGAAKEFSDSAEEVFREALQDRLKSKEGREIVGQISRQVTDHVLVTKVAEIHADASRIPMDDILRIAPSVVAHSAPRAFVEKIVRAEIDAFLALEGDRPVSELLTELGVLDEVRAAVVRRASDIARGFFASPVFGDWLKRHFAAP